MTGNIIQLVMQYFGPQVLDAITKALGITREQAETAVGASVPALLSGVLGRLQTPEGRRTVGSALDSAGTGGLADVGALIRGGDHQRLVESGTGLLGSLFGKSDAGGLAEAVGSFAGVGQGRAQYLLGLAAPAVMGVLGQQRQERGLDLNGLASWLGSQKDIIASAMPKGLVSLLGGTGAIDAMAGRASGA